MRYEVSIEMRLIYLFAIEADNPMDAHAKASDMLGDRIPEELFMHTHVEKGVDGEPT